MSLELDLHPNDMAKQLTGRDYISFSAISAYRACPLRWHFRYVEGLPEALVSSSLIFGGAIHQAVELHYRELLSGNPPPELDMLLNEYQAAWQSRELTTIKFGKGENVDMLRSLAQRMLTAFQCSPLSVPTGQIVGVKEELRGSIAEACPDLLARVDLLIEESDALVVTDLKTAKSRWSDRQAEESGEQLLLYSELAKELLPGKPLRLQFAVITKAKSPSVEMHTLQFDSARIERTRLIVERVWRAMRSGIVYPTPSPLNCSTCPFQAPCRGWRR